MKKVRAKKHLGQHFLKEPKIAERIAESIQNRKDINRVLEIGPGTGILTRALMTREDIDLKLIEIDRESIEHLHERHPELGARIIEGDFLQIDLHSVFEGQPFILAGNFPYNISSQILFRVVENPELIPEMVGMFQKEVAERVVASPGSKVYGILSVLIQTFYRAEYLFSVSEGCFNPPPKVKSGVIRLTRNERKELPIPYPFFKNVVKSAFNQRRKTLRNSLSAFLNDSLREEWAEILSLRPEQLSCGDFLSLAAKLDSRHRDIQSK
jgi:16S rRNA (adenine1518-N6/adenine1519-N6)-dimethyltransferase